MVICKENMIVIAKYHILSGVSSGPCSVSNKFHPFDRKYVDDFLHLDWQQNTYVQSVEKY